MARITITDRGTLDPTEAIDYLSNKGHEVTLLDTLDPRELIARTPDCDGIIASFIELSSETLAELPNLKVIATAAVGFNNIDIRAARAQSVDVCNMPAVASEEVATQALAGMLSLLRELRPSYEQVERGEWDYSRLPMPPRVSELTLGLFSFGRIAREVADRALPFFGRVVAYDPFVPAVGWKEGVDRSESVDGLLELSNVISLHALLNEETRGFLNRETLAKLPQGAYVVNVARGELIDDGALLQALDSGQVRAAFLDVLDQEPPAPNNELARHPNTIVTPHAAFRSATTVRQYLQIPAENVDLVLTGQQPHTLVN